MVRMSYLWRLVTQACCRLLAGAHKISSKASRMPQWCAGQVKMVVVHVPLFFSFSR
ncbi:predicted protein [Brucella suis bv. 3 str. 686]|uniref:Uncharacterized protein n=1 Tax=Brucella canis (strain ATCC 23365 / NCTC 10854 / RM-666) TaxID=483179 RepID=A9M7R5_BRUC2|nr:Hypothetical protein, conserved [Brucella canis ATCC 23365]EEY33797.1 predicted protein [Brucella suis bv. 3 str. 686]CDL75646.1 unnamed protein product [Brucella canis str. Oliveri]